MKFDNVIGSIVKTIMSSKKKVLVIVDADDAFANYNPNLKGKPNSCFFIYLSTNPMQMQNLYLNCFSLVHLGNAALKPIICSEIVKQVRNGIHELFILSNNETMKIQFGIFKQWVPLTSFCQDKREFERLCDFDVQNGKDFQDAWVKVLSQSGTSETYSEVILTENIDGEQLSLSKTGKHFILFAKGLSGSHTIGPTKGNKIEIKSQEHLRLVKNWNERMNIIGLGELKLVPIINFTESKLSDEDDIPDLTIEGDVFSQLSMVDSNPRNRFFEVEYPYRESFEAWSITNEDKNVLRTIQRASMDEHVFKVFSSILSKGFDNEGVSKMMLPELSSLTITHKEAARKLFGGEITGLMFLLREGRLRLNTPFLYMSKYKYSLDLQGIIFKVIPLN